MSDLPKWRQLVRPPDCKCHSCSDECDPESPGHFCGAAECGFFLHTGAGRYCVSTVGDYRPFGKREEIGLRRFYETMVFDKTAGERRWSNIDMLPAKTEAEARDNHAELVRKYQARTKLQRVS